MKTTTPAFLGTALSLVAPICCAALVSASPTPDASAATEEVVLDEPFNQQSAADRFRDRGPGQWRVRDGAYRLTLDRTQSRDRTTRVHAVLRTPVTGDEWQVRATVRGRNGGYSVIFAYEDKRDFSYVHVDRVKARSGVFTVRGTKVTRTARLTGTAPTKGAQRIWLRRDGNKVTVRLAAGRSAPKLAATTTVPAGQKLTAGFASRHTGLLVDHLRITRPAKAPAPSPTPSPTPTSSPRPTPTPTSTPTPTPSPTTSPTPSPSPTSTPVPGGRAVRVSTSDQLTAALAGARPGDVITMADGIYTTKGTKAPLVIGGKQYVGTFVAAVSGTAAAPITLQGSRNAIIDGKPGDTGTGTQYGLYLAGANHFRVKGFTVTNVSKGVVLDRTNHTVLDGLHVHTTGQEAIHLRSFSSDNVVRNNVVNRTGLKNETYGEGIYVGSANSNWGTYSDGKPDASDRNQVVGNVISQTSAESMDIKEGTTGGVIRGNRFEGAGMTGSWADSWIDMKGNGWLVEGNEGVNAVEDGFQVHQALAGWGNDNVFRSNVAKVNGPGYGFWVQKGATGNRIACTGNKVTGAASGFANVACSG